MNAIKIPQGIEVTISEGLIKVKGKLGETERVFNPKVVSVKKKDDEIIVEPKNDLKKSKATTGSIVAHIKNMFEGVTTGYTYKMKIVFLHFPINVSNTPDKFIIKNFGGEKVPRTADILKGVKVSVEGQDIKVTGNDLEKVSQTAANIEQASRFKNRDVRVFQDGIYITEKG